MYVNEYGESAHDLVQDIATGKFYEPDIQNTHKFMSIRGTYLMPPGHCMFVDPYGYGAVPAPNAVPHIPAADLPRVREIIVSAMRAYWDVAKRDHTWREIYPERSDARANAIALARFMSDRRMRFPR